MELLGDLNLEELFKATTQDRLMRYYIKEYERSMRVRLPACARASGKPIEQGITIFDLKGVGVGYLNKGVSIF